MSRRVCAMADAYTGPLAKPTPDTQPFWDAAKRRQLLIQRCTACEEYYFFPRRLCPHCLSRQVPDAEVAICHGTGGVWRNAATAILSSGL